MSLRLGDSTTARPQLVTWDPGQYGEVEDARKRIADLEADGFSVDGEVDGEVRLTPPGRRPNESLMRILSQNGDDRLVWDRLVGDEVRDALKKFNELIAKGYRAYAATVDGKKGHRIDMFNHILEEIIMVPVGHVFPG